VQGHPEIPNNDQWMLKPECWVCEHHIYTLLFHSSTAASAATAAEEPFLELGDHHKIKMTPLLDYLQRTGPQSERVDPESIAEDLLYDYHFTRQFPNVHKTEDFTSEHEPFLRSARLKKLLKIYEPSWAEKVLRSTPYKRPWLVGADPQQRADRVFVTCLFV
jgi:hypothetical protein